jgi:hypothetical protein
MEAGNPFRWLIVACSLFVVLVVAFDLFVLVGHLDVAVAQPAALIGSALALAAVAGIIVMVVTGRRRSQRTRQMLAGDYLIRWHYAQGEWQRFVAQERTLTTCAALVLFPLVLGFAALLVLLSHLWGDPLVAGSVPVLLLLAAVVLVALVATRLTFGGRTRLAGDTYIGPLGVLRPDGYIPLSVAIYHLAGANLVPGSPSQLKLQLRLGRVGSVLALLGNAPTQWEVRVPVPYGHEAEAAQVAVQLLR